jgi:hypothetical protein
MKMSESNHRRHGGVVRSGAHNGTGYVLHASYVSLGGMHWEDQATYFFLFEQSDVCHAQVSRR